MTAMATWQDYIDIDPEIRSGQPCLKGTRITVFDVLEYLAGDMDQEALLSDFPALKTEHIKACLAYAAARERRLGAIDVA